MTKFKRKLNRANISLVIFLIISLLTGAWLYFYIFLKNDTAIYDRSSEFVYNKILKVVSIAPDLILIVTEDPKKPIGLESTGTYGFDAVLAAVENPEETTKPNGPDFKVIKTKEPIGFYKRTDVLKWALEAVNKKYLFKEELKWLELLFEDGYCSKQADGTISCKEYFYFLTNEGERKTKALIFAHNFITFKGELTNHRFETDPDYSEKVIKKWEGLKLEDKTEIIVALINRKYSLGIIDLKKWDKLDDNTKNIVAKEIIENELEKLTKRQITVGWKEEEEEKEKRISHKKALDLFNDAGITVTSTSNSKGVRASCSSGDGCTTLNQIRKSTVDRILALNQECGSFHNTNGCNLKITGGTEPGHASGKYSHEEGWKVDIDDNEKIDSYIASNFTQGKDRNGDRRYYDSQGNEYVRESTPTHWDITVCPSLKGAILRAINEWNVLCNEGVFKGGIDVRQDITKKDGVWDKYWNNLYKNGEKYFGQTYEEYPEKIRITEEQPKREEDIQETEKDKELTPGEYLCQYGTCPPGYDLLIGQRFPPGVMYECATKRLEEARKRLEETPENDTEATIRAIKELEEATLLYHSRCEKRK